MSSKKVNNYHKEMEKHSKKQQLRKAKKNVKRNRDSRPPRRNDWFDFTEEDRDVQTSITKVERIMPRDETDRRKAVESVMYEEVAKKEDDESTPDGIVVGTRGRVTEVSSGLCRVDVDDRTVLCSLRGSLSAEETGYTTVVAVGDWVIVTEDGYDNGVVEQILPRRSQLARPDTFNTHLQHVLVANIDQVLIVASWCNPQLWPELIDRYLITAERNKLTPVLCVNKIDLAESLDEVEAAIRPYRALGVEIIFTSAERGDGLIELREVLAGKISVLAGLSGVGKSSLLTAIQPDFDLRVGAISDDTLQGKHTTTQTNMLPFGDDGYVIDTPGIREFGLAGLYRGDLVDYYPEIAAKAGECRFSDCAHQDEPDCAVRGAVDAGIIAAERYKSYVKIWATLPE